MEFLSSGAPDCPLVRLFDFGNDEACELRRVFEHLASGAWLQVDLSELPFLEAMNGCRLSLSRGDRDSGVEPADDGFNCTLTAMTWQDVAELTEPFCKPNSTGFQWLSTQGTISLLLSPTGRW
ncbi:MAG TPA: hypothetical protein VIM11_22300 [Tepidisphaeraceae bacterium]